MHITLVIYPRNSEHNNSLRNDHSLEDGILFILRMSIDERADGREDLFYSLDEFRLISILFLDISNNSLDILVHNCVLLCWINVYPFTTLQLL